MSVDSLSPAEAFAAAALDDPMVARVLNARRVLVLTGAGISAPSGVPTFRGEGGLYTRDDDYDPPVNHYDLIDRPDEMTRWHKDLHEMVAAAEPNEGHRALAKTQQAVRAAGGKFTIITMNVDSLHEAAGAEVEHLHGRVDSERCQACEWTRPALHNTDPCQECSGQMRTGAVLFGEQTDKAAGAAITDALQELDVIYVIGVSGSTGSCWSLPSRARHLAGATTVLITTDADPDAPYFQQFDIVIEDTAANLAAYLPLVLTVPSSIALRRTTPLAPSEP